MPTRAEGPVGALTYLGGSLRLPPSPPGAPRQRREAAASRCHEESPICKEALNERRPVCHCLASVTPGGVR